MTMINFNKVENEKLFLIITIGINCDNNKKKTEYIKYAEMLVTHIRLLKNTNSSYLIARF